MTRLRFCQPDPVTQDDIAFVADVLGRRPGPMAGVPVRCRFGRPQVVANLPLRPEGGAPMPTLFWLVCPLLVYHVSRLESQGWIRALGREVSSSPEAAAMEARADRVHALLRRRLLSLETRRRLRTEQPRLWARLSQSGVGGRQGPGVKCLHAHLAHYLALGEGYVGRRVAELLAEDAVPLEGSLTCGCREDPGRAPGVPVPERAAVLELGSHSVRALVADRTEAGLRVVEQHLRVSRLGEGLHRGLLGGAPLERTLEAASLLARRAREVGAARILVVGTSAVREATNQEEVARRVREVTGAPLRVLTGEEEARQTFRGALLGLEEPGTAVAVDLGGGSVELALGSLSAGTEQLTSQPWGALRLSRRFGTGTTPERVWELVAWLDRELPGALASWRGVARRRALIAMGGTATSLAAMDQGLVRYRPDLVHGYRLAREALERWVERLASLSPGELTRLPGLQPERAPVILAGTAVLARLVLWVGAVGLRVSEWDLMAGLLCPPGDAGPGGGPGEAGVAPRPRG